MLIRPVLAALCVARLGCLVHDREDVHPYVSSCHNDKVIPDVMLVRTGDSLDNLEMAVVIEMKTPMAFQTKEKTKHKFDDLQILPPGTPVGRALKFNWPDRIPDNESQCRIITQVRLLHLLQVHATHNILRDGRRWFSKKHHWVCSRPLLRIYSTRKGLKRNVTQCFSHLPTIAKAVLFWRLSAGSHLPWET
ncbi:hypothetical protein B0H21DRAFT_755104 [Amylocystis lapponica]|nr:hypothetical protein B0H21DRAFT_755104 [Amylocystis lapponica]